MRSPRYNVAIKAAARTIRALFASVSQLLPQPPRKRSAHPGRARANAPPFGYGLSSRVTASEASAVPLVLYRRNEDESKLLYLNACVNCAYAQGVNGHSEGVTRSTST